MPKDITDVKQQVSEDLALIGSPNTLLCYNITTMNETFN